MDKKNNFKEIALAILSLLGIGTAIYLSTKKELKKIENQEKANKKELQDLGLSENDAEILIKEPETPREEKEGIVKALYTLVRKSSKPEHMMPNDCLDPDAFVGGMEETIFVNEGQNKDRKTIDFVLRIPGSSVKKDAFDPTGKDKYQQKRPEIKDYIRCFNNAATEISNNIAKFSDRPRRRLILCVALTYKNDEMEKPASEFLEIDPSVYEEYSYTDDMGRERDGLTDFYGDYRRREHKEETGAKFREFIKEFSIAHNGADITVVELFPAYKISFDQVNRAGIGVGLKQASKIIQYLVNEVVVEGESSKKKTDQTRYENILFCAPDENGNHSYGWHYEVDPSGAVISAPLEEFNYSVEDSYDFDEDDD